jgi:hypothetical protein
MITLYEHESILAEAVVACYYVGIPLDGLRKATYITVAIVCARPRLDSNWILNN